MSPNLASHGRDGVTEGEISFGVPCGSSGREGPRGVEVVGPQATEREQAEQRRGCAQDGAIGPLALSFHAEMGASFLERDLDLPAADDHCSMFCGVASRSVARKAWVSSSPVG